MFNFARAGAILVDDTGEDAVFEAAMEAGAEDVAPLPEDEEGRPSTSYHVSRREGAREGGAEDVAPLPEDEEGHPSTSCRVGGREGGGEGGRQGGREGGRGGGGHGHASGGQWGITRGKMCMCDAAVPVARDTAVEL